MVDYICHTKSCCILKVSATFLSYGQAGTDQHSFIIGRSVITLKLNSGLIK